MTRHSPAKLGHIRPIFPAYYGDPQTLLCTYLSAVVLAGLVLNATLGWSWADPVAALLVAAIAAREGIEAWRGEGCCVPPPSAPAGASDSGCGEDCCH